MAVERILCISAANRQQVKLPQMIPIIIGVGVLCAAGYAYYYNRPTAAPPAESGPVKPAERELAVSVDFGTWASGFAFFLGGAAADVEPGTRLVPKLCCWPGQSSGYPKTRTALLYKLSNM